VVVVVMEAYVRRLKADIIMITPVSPTSCTCLNSGYTTHNKCKNSKQAISISCCGISFLFLIYSFLLLRTFAEQFLVLLGVYRLGLS
jgi:hypothetical protein